MNEELGYLWSKIQQLIFRWAVLLLLLPLLLSLFEEFDGDRSQLPSAHLINRVSTWAGKLELCQVTDCDLLLPGLIGSAS